MRTLVWSLLLGCPGSADSGPSDTGPLEASDSGSRAPADPATDALFGFLADQQQPSGLLRSFVPHDELPAPFLIYLDNEDPAFTYDNALAAMAWLRRGAEGDHARAASVLDGLIDVQYPDGRVPDLFSLTRKQAVGSSTGNLAWVVLAWVDGYRVLGETRWRNAAQSAAAWLLDPSQQMRNPVGFGSFRLTPGNTVVSTEHALDLYPALTRLADVVDPDLPPSAEALRAAGLEARLFAESQFDPASGTTFTGTGPDGATTARAVLPLDTQTWAALALGTSKSARSLAWAMQPAPTGLWVTSSACPEEGGVAVQGPSFSNADVSDVWTEGLAQARLASHVLGDKAGEAAAAASLDQIRRLAPHTDGRGLVATCSEVGTGFGSSYFNALATGATAWAALAALDANPYWPNGTPTLPTVSLDVPDDGTFACTRRQPCFFTVSGQSEGVAPGQEIRVLVQPTDPGVPLWFTQPAAAVAADGRWAATAQLGSADAGGASGDGLRVVAVLVDGEPPPILDAVTPARVPSLGAVSGQLDATVD